MTCHSEKHKIQRLLCRSVLSFSVAQKARSTPSRASRNMFFQSCMLTIVLVNLSYGDVPVLLVTRASKHPPTSNFRPSIPATNFLLSSVLKLTTGSDYYFIPNHVALDLYYLSLQEAVMALFDLQDLQSFCIVETMNGSRHPSHIAVAQRGSPVVGKRSRGAARQRCSLQVALANSTDGSFCKV